MPYPGAGLGGFPQLGAAPVNVDDFPSVVAALGLQWTPDLFGYTSWSDVLRAIESGNGLFATLLGAENPTFAKYAYIGSPVLVAVVDVWVVFHQPFNGYLPTAAQAIATLGVTGTALNTGPRPASVPVSDYDWHEYAAAVIGAAFALEKLFDAYAPGEVAPVTIAGPTGPVTPLAAWAAALAAGFITVPDTGQQIPESLILDGPTTLPDGTVYVEYHDIVAEAYGENPRPIVWWNGPTYKPRTTSPDNPIVKTANNDLMQLQDRGTGDWYRCMYVYGSDQECRPPLDWTGGYALPDAVGQSLGNQAGAVGAYQPPPPAPIQAPPPTAYQPPPPPVGPQLVDTTPVVTQDENGNLIPATVVSPSPAPTPATDVIVSRLPVSDSTAVAPAAGGGVSTLLLVGVAVAATLILGKRRR